MTNCPNPQGFYYTEDGQAIPAPCGRWDCETCGKVKKNKLLDRVGRGYAVLQQQGKRVRALCLTLGPEAKNEDMGKYFARFRAYLAKPRLHRRQWRSFRKLNYFWTKEFQENGQLHLHVLIDAYIPVAIIKKAWKWATYNTSKIVFITKIHNSIARPAGYMTKYMQKELCQAGNFRPGERRYGFSRGIRSPFLLSSYSYYFRYLPIERQRMSYTYDPDQEGGGQYIDYDERQRLKTNMMNDLLGIENTYLPPISKWW